MNTPRARLALIAGGGFVVMAAFWFAAQFNSRFSFLPQHSPANWILYPTPPDTEMHQAVAMWTVFRREFVLPAQPDVATLELRAFKDFSIALNGHGLTNHLADAANWKRATKFEVASLLKAGTNLLSVIVTNRMGPPALWAALRAGQWSLPTDSSWEASLVGAVWQPSVVAGSTRIIQAGSPLFGAETVPASFRQVWPFWLAGAFLIALALAFREQWLKRFHFIARLTASPRTKWLGLGIVGVAWLLLFTNNLPQMPSLFGFDTDGHTEYIRYVQERGRLPLANEGWQLYQPPLYYVLGVGLLETVALKMEGDSATLLLRAMSGVIGFGHLIFVFLCLRRLFPGQPASHAIGLGFAACVPAMLCVSQFITNEGLAATMSAATLYFTIRLAQTPQPPAWLWSAIGVCLGLALLSKFSAIVLLPFVLGFLALHAANLKTTAAGSRWLGPLLTLAVCAVVCGWHYGRVWARFGNPLVGNWSPESGFAWWQENGFTTAHQFFSFGRALTSPLFSGFDSPGDGLFSTLWADGLCSGGTKMAFRPAWNYALMIAGVWLALVPALLIVLGGVNLFVRWLRQATIESLLWPGLLVAYGLAIAAMTMRVPSYAQAKAVYALAALVPACVCLLVGLDWVRRVGRMVHQACVLVLVVWMANSFACFWIRDGSAKTHEVLAANHLDVGRPAEALAEADRALQIAPDSATAARHRSVALRALGRLEEARAQAEIAHARHGLQTGDWLDQPILAAAKGDYATAIALALDTARQFPDDPLATHHAALWSFEAGRTEAAVDLCRRALRIRFANPALHLLMSKVLAAQAQDAESLNHLRLAAQLKPDWPMALNDLAWTLATHPMAELRNGNEGVAFAERACELTRYQQPQLIGTLAAAYAEAGRFDDATRAATNAIESAEGAGLSELAKRNSELLQLYRASRPYHETR